MVRLQYDREDKLDKIRTKTLTMHLRGLLTLAALWGSAIGQWPCREVSGGGDPTLAGAIARPIPVRPIPLGAPDSQLAIVSKHFPSQSD